MTNTLTVLNALRDTLSLSSSGEAREQVTAIDAATKAISTPGGLVVDDALVAAVMARFNCEAENTTGTRLYENDAANMREALMAVAPKAEGVMGVCDWCDRPATTRMPAGSDLCDKCAGKIDATVEADPQADPGDVNPRRRVPGPWNLEIDVNDGYDIALGMIDAMCPGSRPAGQYPRPMIIAFKEGVVCNFTQELETAQDWLERGVIECFAPYWAADVLQFSNREGAPQASETAAQPDGRDTVRLEWLTSRENRSLRVQGGGDNWSVLDCSNGLTFITRDHPSARAAIDAAIAIITAKKDAS